MTLAFFFSDSRHNAFPDSRKAFILLEALIVIALIGILSVGVIVSVSARINSSSLQEAQAVVMHGLERARSGSAAGIDGINHGVYLKEHSIISFQGDAYTGTGTEIRLSSTVSVTPADNSIVFQRLSARASTDTVITLTHQGGVSKIITVTRDGTIIKE